MMEQRVELSEDLVAEAQRVGEIDGRSIADQIEYWSNLGNILDSAMGADRIQALKQRGEIKSLSQCLLEIKIEVGCKKAEAVWRSGPFPHFEAAEGKTGWLLRTESDGSRRIGPFEGRRFVDYPHET